MARIVTFAEYGAPDVLKIEDIPLPEPGPDEIRIAVKAIGLNRAESMWRTGVYVEAVNLPGRLGYESAGALAPGGTVMIYGALSNEVTPLPMLRTQPSQSTSGSNKSSKRIANWKRTSILAGSSSLCNLRQPPVANSRATKFHLAVPAL